MSKELDAINRELNALPWEPAINNPKVDPHKLGFCCRYACGETCIGCGDAENGLPLPVSN